MELNIRALDGGSPALSSERKIVLRLLASADTIPVFDQSVYVFNVSQEAESGNEIGRVRAESKSDSSELTYSFKSVQMYFAVDRNNVCVRASMPPALDHHV